MGDGAILRKCTTLCGTTIYLPAHGYHMPKACIRLEYTQSVIREMGDSGHDVIGVWNVEWHLPDNQIIDITIDPGTNLPLIHDYFCTSSEKEKHGTHHVDNAVVLREKYVGSNIDNMDHYDLKKYILCCTSVADETNKNISGAQKEFLHWHQELCLNM